MDVLHLLLGVSAALLVGLGICLLVRLRRLARASETQFIRAVQEVETPNEESR
jgi:hypothetical protein